MYSLWLPQVQILPLSWSNERLVTQTLAAAEDIKAVLEQACIRAELGNPYTSKGSDWCALLHSQMRGDSTVCSRG